MSNVLNRTTKQYLPSVNTPDYPSDEWIINPDLSAVTDLPSKYWVIEGDAVRKMTRAESDALNATSLAASKAEAKDGFDLQLDPTVAQIDAAKAAVDAATTEEDVRKVRVR